MNLFGVGFQKTDRRRAKPELFSWDWNLKGNLKGINKNNTFAKRF